MPKAKKDSRKMRAYISNIETLRSSVQHSLVSSQPQLLLLLATAAAAAEPHDSMCIHADALGVSDRPLGL